MSPCGASSSSRISSSQISRGRKSPCGGDRRHEYLAAGYQGGDVVLRGGIVVVVAVTIEGRLEVGQPADLKVSAPLRASASSPPQHGPLSIFSQPQRRPSA